MSAQLGLRRAALVFVLAISACEPITVNPAPPVTIYQPAWETSSTWALGPASGGLLVIGYNDFGGPTLHGWSTSTDGGQTWVRCNAGLVGCGGPGMPVPFAKGLLGSLDQAAWAGDPAMAGSFYDPGVVVASNIAVSTAAVGSGVADGVVVSLSFDGGQTFVSSQFVNDSNCVGSEDQETLTVDRRLLGTRLWVAWRHRGAGFFGACVRGGDVDLVGRRVRWLAAPAPLPTAPELGFGTGGLIVQAAGSRVTVVYSNRSSPSVTCETYGVGWRSTTSLDGGRTWSRDRLVHVSLNQQSCIPDPTSGPVLATLRNFGFALDVEGHAWVAVPEDGQTAVRIFYSDDDADTWEEVAQVEPGAAGLVFLPTLAVDDQGRVLLSFRSVEPDGSGARAWVSANPLGAELPGFFLPASQMQGPIGPIAALRQHGDYDGIATLPTGALPSGATFFPTWSRSDGAMGAASVVDGSLVTVTP